jgi:hypothetical protein
MGVTRGRSVGGGGLTGDGAMWLTGPCARPYLMYTSNRPPVARVASACRRSSLRASTSRPAAAIAGAHPSTSTRPRCRSFTRHGSRGGKAQESSEQEVGGRCGRRAWALPAPLRPSHHTPALRPHAHVRGAPRFPSQGCRKPRHGGSSRRGAVALCLLGSVVGVRCCHWPRNQQEAHSGMHTAGKGGGGERRMGRKGGTGGRRGNGAAWERGPPLLAAERLSNKSACSPMVCFAWRTRAA